MLPILLINFFIIISYDIFDIDVYIIPTIFIFSIFFGLSIDFILSGIDRISFIKNKIINRVLSLVVIIIILSASMYGFKDNYIINDRSQDFDHYIRAKKIESVVNKDSVIIFRYYY